MINVNPKHHAPPSPALKHRASKPIVEGDYPWRVVDSPMTNSYRVMRQVGRLGNRASFIYLRDADGSFATFTVESEAGAMAEELNRIHGFK